MKNVHVGIIDNWIRHIKDVYRLNQQELDAIENEDLRFKRFVELNVIEQVNDLAKTSIVQGAWKKNQKIGIHGWVYGLEDGLIKDLNVTMWDESNLPPVYKLEFPK
jgi:carbonic anhydrase